LREIAAGGRELALRATELFEHEIGKPGVGLADTDLVLQSFIVKEHQNSMSQVMKPHRISKHPMAGGAVVVMHARIALPSSHSHLS
jgi:hypothetical protein